MHLLSVFLCIILISQWISQPFSSEAFFLLRDKSFLESEAFQTRVPPSARHAFVEAVRSEVFTTSDLRHLIMEKAPGRWVEYNVCLSEPPFVFNPRLVLSKVRELREQLAAASSYAGGRTPLAVAKVVSLRRDLLLWWFLLKEQLNFSGGDALMTCCNVLGVPDSSLLAEVRACVEDQHLRALERPDGGDSAHSQMGHANVAAHGVRLDAASAGVAVARSLRAMVNAYFPHASPPSVPHSHFAARAMQEAYVDAYSQPFAGDGRRGAVESLAAEAVFAEEELIKGCKCERVRAVFLQAGPGQGCTATIAAVVARLLPDPSDDMIGKCACPTRILAYFFAAPGRGTLNDALLYLSTEVSLQHMGKIGLEGDTAAGQTPRDLFVAAIRRAVGDGLALVLVAEGLATQDQFALLAAARAGSEVGLRCGTLAVTVLLGPATQYNGSLDKSGGSKAHGTVRQLVLQPLDALERAAVCRAWMRQFGKENPSERIVSIAAAKGSAVQTESVYGGGIGGCCPAYLALLCLEASTVGLFEGIDFELEQMPADLGLLWRDRTLPRLEAAHGAALVQVYFAVFSPH